MSDPKNENSGATPPEGASPDAAGSEAQAPPEGATDASEAQTQATPGVESSPEQAQAAAVTAEQPTPVAPHATAEVPAAPVAAPAGPGTPWYRRRWAVVTGAVAAGVILFLGGMAVGSTFDGRDRGDFGRDFHGQAPDGQDLGRQGWGDGGQGMLPPMGQGGQGYGHGRDGDGPHGEDRDYGRPQEAPSAAPSAAPSTAPQAYSQ